MLLRVDEDLILLDLGLLEVRSPIVVSIGFIASCKLFSLSDPARSTKLSKLSVVLFSYESLFCDTIETLVTYTRKIVWERELWWFIEVAA